MKTGMTTMHGRMVKTINRKHNHNYLYIEITKKSRNDSCSSLFIPVIIYFHKFQNVFSRIFKLGGASRFFAVLRTYLNKKIFQRVNEANAKTIANFSFTQPLFFDFITVFYRKSTIFAPDSVIKSIT